MLTLTCKDRTGIVSAIAGFLAARDGFILDSQQFADLEHGKFFMRVCFRGDGAAFPQMDVLRTEFEHVAQKFGLDWELVDTSILPNVVIAVSKGSHCLHDLLYRWRSGALAVNIKAVVSNHENLRDLAQWHDVPFHYLPMGHEGKAAQEQQILDVLSQYDARWLILARYMQILSNDMVEKLSGRCINIHHSFLPSFIGARPYHRAHDRGVKLIGATAHFVTADLDEGPIIEQAVDRVDHRDTVEDMIRIGRDIEAQVLSRAVKWVAESRVLLNGNRTVVFK
ncbi:formyltetrahydrofolate deformylase [Sphingorhabdus lutea]|uniref:Formyltetrahydrofolate deformylase n=1 Tax=Sphingorhabdus lutea TaxID=1913578 RepID=A0A1L3JEX9_9SPHN|nr:formyltetrahydrofolate deformylase [Sphingorhabdus lutea]APG63613.1 formyltetrahydrofolate deformylase [Sphingorhabdus lutea]